MCTLTGPQLHSPVWSKRQGIVFSAVDHSQHYIFKQFVLEALWHQPRRSTLCSPRTSVSNPQDLLFWWCSEPVVQPSQFSPCQSPLLYIIAIFSFQNINYNNWLSIFCLFTGSNQCYFTCQWFQCCSWLVCCSDELWNSMHFFTNMHFLNRPQGNDFLEHVQSCSQRSLHCILLLSLFLNSFFLFFDPPFNLCFCYV